VKPSGTITFLFTDIEGSTKLWEQWPEAMRTALMRHDSLLREAIERHEGYVFKTVGDAFCAAFHTAPDALRAAIDSLVSLQAEPWAETGRIKVRVALHTGAADERDNDYFGPEVNRVARLLSIGHGDQLLLSQPAFELTRDYIEPGAELRDMGMHRLKDLFRAEHVYQLRHPDLPTDFPALKSLDSLRTNLPQQVSSFVGRERELREVTARLAETRILTLTGSGGTGKTRLALQVAADVIESFSDGDWLIELAAVTDPALVPQAFASALGIKDEPGQSLTNSVIDELKSKTVLLVVDNCEHVLAACAAMVDALAKSCPGLRVLASSREALNIPGETIYKVPALAVPDPNRPPPPDSLSQYESVRLFIERAVAMQPTFTITNQNAPAVAQICAQLDGMPLAIELAAARCRMMTPEQIAARLDDRFKLLTGGSRTLLPRQQTLRALIDWSFDMLSDEEKAVFARLSVFAGGWTLEAAAAITAGEGIELDSVGLGAAGPRHYSADVESWQVLDLITQLVDKSLIIYDDTREAPRYRMLETLRQYGRDRLNEGGESELAHKLHAAWFAELAGLAEKEWMGSDQRVWLDRIELEHDNMRAALEWCQQHGHAETALRLANGLGRFWLMRGYLTEGRIRIARTLAMDSSRHDLTGVLLLHAGSLAFTQGDLSEAKAHWDNALPWLREIGDERKLAAALSNLGVVAWQQADFEAAKAYSRQALQLRRKAGDDNGIAISLNQLANIARAQGDLDAALRQFAEAAELFKATGDHHSLAMALYNLGAVVFDRADYGESAARFEESLAIRREIGDRQGVASSLMGLGAAAQMQGDYPRSSSFLEEALAIQIDLVDRAGELATRNMLARLELIQGDLAAAKELLASCLNRIKETGNRHMLVTVLETGVETFRAEANLPVCARVLGGALSFLAATGTRQSTTLSDIASTLAGDATFQENLAAGRLLSAEETIDAALFALSR
jgi:predicted ATPase/class 3 adenylate cyclase